jgi:hypothetical protein
MTDKALTVARENEEGIPPQTPTTSKRLAREEEEAAALRAKREADRVEYNRQAEIQRIAHQAAGAERNPTLPRQLSRRI